jgi:hypothetical protein
MIGPHQSIICSFTWTGQGAAAWVATRWLEKSWRVRSAVGSFSMRTNMVGTHWLWVTRSRSSSPRASSGSNRSMTTTVPPTLWTPMATRNGAEW